MDETHAGPSWPGATPDERNAERNVSVGDASGAVVPSRSDRVRRVLLIAMLFALLIAWVVLLRVVH